MSLSHILLLCSLVACVWGQARVLVFTATAGFRHDSIPTAIQSLKTQNTTDMLMEFSEDSTLFTNDNLARYDVVMFLSTTGEILNTEQKAAFQQFLNSGGNFMGVHCATATLETDAFYKKEIGALFEYHPECTDAVVEVIDSSHPSTSMLPARWKVRDEMYNFASNPRDEGAVVVLAADESTYNDPGTKSPWQGSPHPLAWYQTHGAGVDSNGIAGRSFYTALGHLNQSWQDPLFMQHILGGLTWTSESGTTRATNASALVGNPTPLLGAVSTSASPSPTATTKSTSQTSGSVKVAAHILTFAVLTATCEILISSLM